VSSDVVVQWAGISFEALELSASISADSQLFLGHGWKLESGVASVSASS
jgi:hypothetical protein